MRRKSQARPSFGQKLPPVPDAAEFAAEVAFLWPSRSCKKSSGRKSAAAAKSWKRRSARLTKSAGDRRRLRQSPCPISANHTLAAYFRMGYVFELYAKAF